MDAVEAEEGVRLCEISGDFCGDAEEELPSGEPKDAVEAEEEVRLCENFGADFRGEAAGAGRVGDKLGAGRVGDELGAGRVGDELGAGRCGCPTREPKDELKAEPNRKASSDRTSEPLGTSRKAAGVLAGMEKKESGTLDPTGFPQPGAGLLDFTGFA